MKSIRRLYFYLVAFISIEVVLWGMVGLLRSIANQTVSGGAEALAQALALILVGVPIFLVHWLWAQRASARDDEEKTATLRAVFLYAILLGTLIPVVQNTLSFIDRSLVQATGLGVERAFSSFREQSIADNFIAILMNGIVAAYFWNVLRGDWATLSDRKNFSEVRRLYRYIWMLYGLLMTVFGTQQILRFIFYIPGDVIGEIGREVVVNGTALILIGTPVWVYAWRVIQDSLSDPAEMGSTLRLSILYLLSLGGVITVITAAWNVVNIILGALFGGDFTFHEFIREIGGPISIGVPLGMVWAYFGHWLNRHIEAVGDQISQAGMKRLYNYILSFIGLVVSFVGVVLLFSFFIDLVIDRNFVTDNFLRESLINALSSLLVGLPLWILMWRPMQAEALAQNELGEHSRRSVLRRSYLYLVLFFSVIGGMGTAVGLVYQLIVAALEGVTASDFANTVLNLALSLFLFSVVLVYHLSVLRRDGAATADTLEEKQGAFRVVIVDSDGGFVDSIKAALMKLGSKVQIIVASPAEKPEGEFNGLIVSGTAAVDASAWIRSFDGVRLIVQNDAQNLVWADDAAQAGQFVQQLAEGEEIRKQRQTRSAWMYVVYVLAALFAFQLLFILLAIGISLVTSF
ncbi:MAG TPA: DUF5671 domain-containing protein [Anaerolineales bacterium]|nr:DUF5671 domain-containing protein [Anaerolineales bacterium]